jgi:heptosyltransferase II
VNATTAPLAATIRTLVVVPNWVGDVVMALPVLEALAQTDRSLHVLCKPHLVPLLALVEAVAGTIPRAAGDSETVAAIRQAALDEAVILPSSFRSAWLPFRAGIPYRWGYTGGWRAPILHPAVPRPRGKRPQVEDYRELLATMDAPLPPAWVPRLRASADLLARGRAKLERAHIRESAGPLVGLFAGAEFGPSKRWPWERFAEVARELRRAMPTAQLVILAGPKEVWLSVRIHEESGKLHPVLGPDLDLAGLAAVVAHLDLLVTNDSGPMHLAAAMGVPCLALFGPTDPRRTAPAGAGHQVLYTDRWCSPCFRRRCPLVHQKCLRDIDVARVVETARGMLEPATSR